MMAFGASVDAIRDRMAQLRASTSSPNWDADGATPLDPEVISHAERLAKYVVANAPLAPDPFISPCGDGTVHLRWRTSSAKVVVEVGAEQCDWFVKSATDFMEGVCRSEDDVVELVQKHLRHA